MRKFIISDLHGNGNIYRSIMGYLNNLNEEVYLYINGDLIDRGLDSAKMLLDIFNHEYSDRIKIIYLGGNHELLMFQEYKKRLKGINNYFNSWFDNGGNITDEELCEKLNYNKDKILEVVDFISELKIYHKFDEKMNGKNIILVHAACPLIVKDECDLKIKDDNDSIEYYLWTRKDEIFLPFRCRIGNNKYFTIIGHTPVNFPYGYQYYQIDNYLNIDGGCAPYVSGMFEYNHVPLLEIENELIKILTFNNNNDIIYGNYFINGKSIPFSESELNKEKTFLDKNVLIRKLYKNEDGVVYYKD